MTKPRRVTWTHDDELRCAILAGLGFSTLMICAETGLTPCQVSYRLHKAKIKRKDYRDGTSDVARRILESSVPRSPKVIRSLLNLTVIS